VWNTALSRKFSSISSVPASTDKTPHALLRIARSIGLANRNPANKRLRKVVKDSIGDYKGLESANKNCCIWGLVMAFQSETDPKRRFLERSAKGMPWREAPKERVYDMIQKMFCREREDDHQDAGTASGHAETVGTADRTTPFPCPDVTAESKGEDSASLKTETSSLNLSRKVRKRRKSSSAGSMARRRLESTECVESINDNDVMCDGGIRQGADDSRGNAQLFELLEWYKMELPEEGADERRIAESVVHHIRHMEPPGRFLKENADGKWYHVGTCWFRSCLLLHEPASSHETQRKLTILYLRQRRRRGNSADRARCTVGGPSFLCSKRIRNQS
jgi:hypothetical protein